MLFHRLPWLVVIVGCFVGAGERRALAEDIEIVRHWSFDSPEDLRGWEAGRGIGDLKVDGGKLTGKLVHPDAYLFAPPLRTPVDGLVIKVRWSCPRRGTGQCYFTTDRSPQMGEDKVRSKEVPGGEWTDTEFPIDPDGRSAALLTRFRLDPFNGIEGAPFAIDEVSVVRLPTRIEIGFGPTRSFVRVGEAVTFRVSVRHLGGRRPAGSLEAVVESHGAGQEKLKVTLAGEDAQATCALTFRKAGTHVARAQVYQDGQRSQDLETSIVVGAPTSPGRLTLTSDSLGVELLPSARDAEAVRAGRLWVRDGGGWNDAGLLLPLVELVVEEAGVVRRTHPALRVVERGDRQLRLRGAGTKGGWQPRLTLRFAKDRGPGHKEVVLAEASLTGPRDGRLLKFSGVSLRRLAGSDDALQRHGIFGGLEFLEPGWRSSSERAVGPKFAARWTPHPFKVCLPVMAIEESGVTTAVLWNPLDEWAPGKRMPAVTFSSPDFLGARPDHLLEVFAPSVPDFVGENESLARRPFLLSGDPVRLSVALHAAPAEPVVQAARRWYEHFGIPEAPPAPHDETATYDLIARSYGETVYWPEDKGWRHHWFLDTSSRFRPEMAAELILHAKVTGERRWLEATGLQASQALIEVVGPLWRRALGSAGPAEASVRRMREDGTYAYHEPSRVKEATRRHTGGRFDSLGEDGATTLGTCVQGALPLAHHVLLTAEPKRTEVLEKVLRALRKFRAPRGAQVWEVPLEVPDIRAAALAIEVYRIGYLVTGDDSYLEDAFYWANSGLPFLFTWRTPHDPEPATVRTSRDRNNSSERRPLPAGELFVDPRRQVNPYGTIPVLGTTYYVISWFGVLVQWCGLEWAWKVLDLCAVRDDAILRAAAEGVVRSGLQQTFDREPWTGIYPDVWNLEGNWAGGALICSHLTVQALRAGGHIPQALRIWNRRVGTGRDALLVHGWGEVVSCAGSAEGLTVALRFLPNEPGELLVARSPRPLSVKVANTEPAELMDETREGWRYDAERRLLGIRYVSPAKEVTVSVRYR